MPVRGLVLGCLVVLASGCAGSRGEQLCAAIAGRDVAAVQRLLAGPQIDATARHGTCVPADVLAVAGPGDAVLTDIAIELLKAGLPPDASWVPTGRTDPVWAIEAAARNGNEKLVRALLAVGLDMTGDAATKGLVDAAGAGHLGVVTVLVEGGADLNATSRGETALDRARSHDRAEVVQYLEAAVVAREADAARRAGTASADEPIR